MCVCVCVCVEAFLCYYLLLIALMTQKLTHVIYCHFHMRLLFFFSIFEVGLSLSSEALNFDHLIVCSSEGWGWGFGCGAAVAN